MQMQKIAMIISWMSWAPFTVFFVILLIAFSRDSLKVLYLLIPINILLLMHASLMIKRKRIASLRFAMGELFIIAYALSGLLFFPNRDEMQRMSIYLAVILWFLGGSIIAIAGWVCHKAVLEIKSGINPENSAYIRKPKLNT